MSALMRNCIVVSTKHYEKALSSALYTPCNPECSLGTRSASSMSFTQSPGNAPSCPTHLPWKVERLSRAKVRVSQVTVGITEVQSDAVL